MGWLGVLGLVSVSSEGSLCGGWLCEGRAARRLGSLASFPTPRQAQAGQGAAEKCGDLPCIPRASVMTCRACSARLKLAEKLPTAKEEAEKRKELFNQFDPNGNGYLSLAEIDKGLIETFGLHGGDNFSTKRCKPAIMRAYQALHHSFLPRPPPVHARQLCPAALLRSASPRRSAPHTLGVFLFHLRRSSSLDPHPSTHASSCTWLQAAKDVGQVKSKLSDDYVTKKEFRLLLVYLRRYFELLAMFDEVPSVVAVLPASCPAVGPAVSPTLLPLRDASSALLSSSSPLELSDHVADVALMMRRLIQATTAASTSMSSNLPSLPSRSGGWQPSPHKWPSCRWAVSSVQCGGAVGQALGVATGWP